MLIKVETVYDNQAVYLVPDGTLLGPYRDAGALAAVARTRGRCVATRSRAGVWEYYDHHARGIDLEALPLTPEFDG